MSEPERESPPPSTLAALYAAERARPRLDDAGAQAIVAGVQARLGPTSGSQGGGTEPDGGGAPPAPAGGTTSLLSASHAIALTAGLLTGILVGALGHAALTGAPATDAAANPVRRAPATSEHDPAEATPEDEPTPAPSTAPEPLPVDEVGSLTTGDDPTPAAPPVAPELSGSATLAGERRLIDTARAALASGRHQPALLALASHQRRYPRGALAEERDALEVEALAGAERREEAARAARSFLEAYPSSLYRSRVQSLVTESAGALQ